MTSLLEAGRTGIAVFAAPYRVGGLSLQLGRSLIGSVGCASCSCPSNETRITTFIIANKIARCRIVVRTASPGRACHRRVGTILSTCTTLLGGRLSKTITIFGECFLDSTTGRTRLLLTTATRDSSYTLSIIRRPPLSNAGVTL